MIFSPHLSLPVPVYAPLVTCLQHSACFLLISNTPVVSLRAVEMTNCQLRWKDRDTAAPGWTFTAASTRWAWQIARGSTRPAAHLQRLSRSSRWLIMDLMAAEKGAEPNKIKIDSRIGLTELDDELCSQVSAPQTSAGETFAIFYHLSRCNLAKLARWLCIMLCRFTTLAQTQLSR